jgi:hypothetical protein
MLRFSLRRLFVTIAAVAVCIGMWTALGRVFGIYTILLVAIVWASEYLSVRTRLAFSLVAVLILCLAPLLAEAPIRLLAGDEYGPPYIRPVFVYAFWIAIFAALALSALTTYIRNLVARKPPPHVFHHEGSNSAVTAADAEDDKNG